MPDQLDVHRNAGRNKRNIPFVVVVQSNRFRSISRRVVVPLIVAAEFGRTDNDIQPHFVIAGAEVVLAPLLITNVPADVLGLAVASLVKEETRIVNAMDALLSRAWR